MLKETLEEKTSHDDPVATLSPQESADTTSSTHSLPPSIEPTHAKGDLTRSYQALCEEQTNLIKAESLDIQKFIQITKDIFRLLPTITQTRHTDIIAPFLTSFSAASTLTDLHQQANSCINAIPGQVALWIPMVGSKNLLNSRGRFATACIERILKPINEALKNTALNADFKVTINDAPYAPLTTEATVIRAEIDHPFISYLSQGTQTDPIEDISIALNERIQSLQAQLAAHDATRDRLQALIRPPTRIHSYQGLSTLQCADCTQKDVQINTLVSTVATLSSRSEKQNAAVYTRDH